MDTERYTEKETRMSTRSQRGRAVRKQSNPNRAFYIILAIVGILGVAAIGIIVLGARQQPPPTTTSSPNVDPGRPGQRVLPISSFPFKGNADAPVTVVEYSDFQCPACGYYATSIAPDIDKTYVETGKIRFVYHEYPLPQHNNAIAAAEAGRCAADQNAFWPMHDLLFQRQTAWESIAQPASTFAGYATELNLDRAAFESCMSSAKHRPTILQAQQDGNNVGINQTPTFEINGRRYSMSDLRGGIEQALAGR